MRRMRAIAAEVRRDALSGIVAEDQEAFVDTLLAIKSNLVRLGNGAGTIEHDTGTTLQEASS
jgi:hypothetical protein